MLVLDRTGYWHSHQHRLTHTHTRTRTAEQYPLASSHATNVLQLRYEQHQHNLEIRKHAHTQGNSCHPRGETSKLKAPVAGGVQRHEHQVPRKARSNLADHLPVVVCHAFLTGWHTACNNIQKMKLRSPSTCIMLI